MKSRRFMLQSHREAIVPTQSTVLRVWPARCPHWVKAEMCTAIEMAASSHFYRGAHFCFYPMRASGGPNPQDSALSRYDCLPVRLQHETTRFHQTYRWRGCCVASNGDARAAGDAGGWISWK